MLSFLKSKSNPIAADIGTESIKLLQLANGPEQPRLLAAATAEIPEDLRTPANARQRDAFVGDALKKALASAPFKGKQVVTCLPASSMAVQHLRVTRMNEEELKKALPFEAAGKLPFDASRAVLRHVVAGEIYQDQEAKTEVILLAASRESVDRHMALFGHAHLEVVGIHVEPSALIECFSYLFRRKGDENLSTMFVDIGAGCTHVVIAHGKHMVFAKHAPVGGDTFNKRAAEALKTGLPAARAFRAEVALQAGSARLPAGVVAIHEGSAPNALNNAARANGHPAVDPALVEKVLAALAEPMETLISDLEMCVRYYESIFPGKQIDRVIFVGGESRHVALCQAIARRLNLPATLGDPLARLVKDNAGACDVDLRVPQPGWAIAVGLGLGVKAE